MEMLKISTARPSPVLQPGRLARAAPRPTTAHAAYKFIYMYRFIFVIAKCYNIIMLCRSSDCCRGRSTFRPPSPWLPCRAGRVENDNDDDDDDVRCTHVFSPSDDDSDSFFAATTVGARRWCWGRGTGEERLLDVGEGYPRPPVKYNRRRSPPPPVVRLPPRHYRSAGYSII